MLPSPSLEGEGSILYISTGERLAREALINEKGTKVRVRLVNPIFLQVKPEGIYLSSPRVKRRIRLHHSVASVLLDPLKEIDLDEVRDRSTDLAAAIEQLLSLGFLCNVEGADRGEEIPSPWSEWGGSAWQFHHSIRDAPFVKPDSEGHAGYSEALAGRQRPRNSKPIGPETPVLLLPRVRAKMSSTFDEVLEVRRTHRDFAEAPVPLESFATLMHYAFAPLRFADAGRMGVVQLRANASGGARHETEAYVMVFNIEDVDPGVYRYDSIRHGLISVRNEVTRDYVEFLTHQQGFFESSGFGIFTTAVATRMSWKYPHPRAYKMLLQNVGHVAQVFSMTAVALGLGASLTGAFRDSEVEEFLGLGGAEEFPTFALSCGIPEKRDDGLPIRHQSPNRPFIN